MAGPGSMARQLGQRRPKSAGQAIHWRTDVQAARAWRWWLPQPGAAPTRAAQARHCRGPDAAAGRILRRPRMAGVRYAQPRRQRRFAHDDHRHRLRTLARRRQGPGQRHPRAPGYWKKWASPAWCACCRSPRSGNRRIWRCTCSARSLPRCSLFQPRLPAADACAANIRAPMARAISKCACGKSASGTVSSSEVRNCAPQKSKMPWLICVFIAPK